MSFFLTVSSTNEQYIKSHVYLFRYYKNPGKNTCALIIEARMWAWDSTRKESELAHPSVVHPESMISLPTEENPPGR